MDSHHLVIDVDSLFETGHGVEVIILPTDREERVEPDLLMTYIRSRRPIISTCVEMVFAYSICNVNVHTLTSAASRRFEESVAL
jgi:hypothetical protein